MTISADRAMRDAPATVRLYALTTRDDLLDLLHIEITASGKWREQLEPFAAVWAAMIAASATDFDTSCSNGVVEDCGPARERGAL